MKSTQQFKKYNGKQDHQWLITSKINIFRHTVWTWIHTEQKFRFQQNVFLLGEKVFVEKNGDFVFCFLCISTSSYRSGVWKRKFRAAYDSQENLNEICSLLLQNSGQFWPTTAGRCFACIAFVLAKGGKEETHDEFHGIALAIIDLYKYFCDSEWPLFCEENTSNTQLCFSSCCT